MYQTRVWRDGETIKVYNQSSLSQAEIQQYRRNIERMDAESHSSTGDPLKCPEEVWKIYGAKKRIGRLIYGSFTDDELLDILIRVMDHPGRKPHYDELFCIYKEYIRLRFEGLDNARKLANARLKDRDNRKKYPPDWPERLSVEPVERALEHRNKTLSQENRSLLESLIERAKQTGLPPVPNTDEKKRLDNLGMGGVFFVLSKAGFPMLSKSETARMRSYWERKPSSQGTESKNDERAGSQDRRD